MTYEEFQKELLNHLQRKCGKGVTPELTHQLKENGLKKTGITLRCPDTISSPIIYLEDSFEQYQHSGGLDEIADEVLRLYRAIPKLNISEHFLADFNHIKGTITMKLINTEKNRAFLETVPHIPFEDLSLVYYCVLNVMDRGRGTMLIDNMKAALWSVDAKTLHQYALANYTDLLSASFMTMGQQIEAIFLSCSENLALEENSVLEMPDDGFEDCMYVLSNKCKQWGAALMTCKSLMDDIADFFREDFYILPSSIHELVLIPDSKSLSKDELDLLIQDINQTQVPPEEYLSDHAYHYSKKGKNTIPCFGQGLFLS